MGSVGSVRTFVTHAAPRLAPDILITVEEERLLILRWRRPATRESPRTAAGPIHSCAGHRCVGQGYGISRLACGFSAATVPTLTQSARYQLLPLRRCRARTGRHGSENAIALVPRPGG